MTPSISTRMLSSSILIEGIKGQYACICLIKPKTLLDKDYNFGFHQNIPTVYIVYHSSTTGHLKTKSAEILFLLELELVSLIYG
jgi:hypothetical protein